MLSLAQASLGCTLGDRLPPGWPGQVELVVSGLATVLGSGLGGALAWWGSRRPRPPDGGGSPVEPGPSSGDAGPGGGEAGDLETTGAGARRSPPPPDVEADAVLGVGHLQRIAFLNPRAERLFGYAAAEAIGLDLHALLPIETPRGRRPHIRDLAREGESREMVGRRRDGGVFTAEVSVTMRTRDGQTSYAVVIRDVTARQRAEAALRESETRFRGAFEHSPAGMAVRDSQGTLVQVNRALCELLGYPESELVGRSHQSLFDPEDAAPEEWYERDLRAGSIRWYQREQRYRHREGHVVWGLLSVSALRDPDGRFSHCLVQVHDITERKRAEALEARLREAQRIEAVGRLAAGVAHDFNNLLMVISGRSHILLHRLPGDDPRRRHVELIQATAGRAGALTRQLLAFSRKAALEPAVIDLNETIASLEPMLRRLLGEPVSLETVPGAEIGRIRADRSQIEQVVLNLSVNGRDAMPGGGRLRLETCDAVLDEEFAIHHPGARPGRYVALRVQDTGSGMDAATRARLFEPFFTTKEAGRGTGLGLALVYGVVKEAGGYIDVESEVGHGSTFTVYLPRVEEAVTAAEPTPTVVEAPGGTETILLVEDEDAVRDLAREILQQAGYTVLGARHGGEALLLGDRHRGPIDLLLTDVVMPEAGGPHLAERVAATRPGLKVLFMSGYTDDTLEPYGVLGSSGFIRKPITPEALIRKVREVLDEPIRPGA